MTTQENTNTTQTQDRYVAALEISSSKIIGAVGRTRGKGDLSVIAVEQERGVECVRYGRIQNVEEAYIRISRILDKLERRPSVSPRKIQAVYIGLAGRSMRNITTEVGRNLPEDTEITETILQALRDEALHTSIDSSLEIVDAVPRSFHVNKSETKMPVGSIGNSIRATYDLIACAPVLKRNIGRVVHDKLNIDINGYVVTPLAVGHLILTAEEKRLGCMLVDLGAETTTVSIYKNGNLQYLATIPLGSRNITKDITKLSILEERAEEIKITSGNAIAPETPSTLNLNGVKLSDVSNLVVARSEEIVANINEQITYAGMTDDEIPAGIIAIGGGFKLNGLIELMERQCNLKVRRGSLPQYVDLEDTKAPTSETLELISILYAGATLSDKPCLATPSRSGLPQIGEAPEEEKQQPEHKPDKEPRPSKYGGFLSKIKGGITKMFDPGSEDDDSEL